MNQLLFQFINALDVCMVNTFLNGRPHLIVSWVEVYWNGSHCISAVRNLGILFDCNVWMRTHVSRTVSSCFVVLGQLRSIRWSVSPAVPQSLVVSLVLSRLDYGNATLALPGNQLNRMQTVINGAARLVCYA